MKKKLIEIAMQIIPVMIGVYLGFVVNNWTDEKKSQSQAQQLLMSLKLEIESNEKKLFNVSDYHIIVRDSARHYLTSKTLPAKRPTFFQGTRTPFLMNSAFDTGIQTGLINELSLDLIQKLNELYTLQNSYNEYSNIIVESFINMEQSGGRKSMQSIGNFLATTMTDIVIKEQNLFAGYDIIKDKIEHEK